MKHLLGISGARELAQAYNAIVKVETAKAPVSKEAQAARDLAVQTLVKLGLKLA